MASGWTIDSDMEQMRRDGAFGDAVDRALSYMQSEGYGVDDAVARGFDEAFTDYVDQLSAVFCYGATGEAFALVEGALYADIEQAVREAAEGGE